MIGALDIGGTKIAAGVVDLDGRVIVSRQFATCSFESALQRMAAMLTDFGSALDGIGIGCTGPVDPFAGVIGDAELLAGWRGAPIVERLSAKFGVPVVMENDADAVALSEARWGQGLGAECLVYVTVGTGIGAGIVRNGELYRGAAGGHPEIGHMAVDLSGGPKCYCGLTGCWESLASGSALGEEICRRAREGDATARPAVARFTRYLAIGLVNVATAFCPDAVLLGGGVMRDADLFLDDVRRTVYELATQVPTANLRIEAVDMSKHAGLQGAAAAWLHRMERRA